MVDLTFPLQAPGGGRLNARGWLQEAMSRRLLDNLEPDAVENIRDLLGESSDDEPLNGG